MAKMCTKCQMKPVIRDDYKFCPSCFKAERGGNVKSDKSQGKPERARKCPYCNRRILPPDRTACLSCRPDYKITGDPSKTADGGYEVLVQTYQNGKQIGPVDFEWQVTDAGFIPAATDTKGVAKLVIPPSLKNRQFTLHVIGSEGDTPAMELAGEPTVPKVVNVDAGAGLYANFRRGFLGKE